MKKVFILIVVCLTAISTWAYDVEMDGVYYNLNTTEKTAEVTSGNNYYTGSVTIPESIVSDGVTYSVTSIGGNAFFLCSGLTSVTIGNSVTSIGEFAFYCCSGLTSVTIPNSVTSIGRGAFGECSGLTSVTIPNSVTSIEYGAFSFCTGLGYITVETGNTVYDSRENCNALIETSSNTLIAGCKNTIIPNSVTSIGSSAFAGCSGLTSVTIPNSVTSIGDYAFYECSGLTSVTIGNSVTSIGSWAFMECRGLTSVYNYATTPQKLSSSDTFTYPEQCTLYVPNGCVNTYKAANYWNYFKEIIEMDPAGINNVKNAPTGGQVYNINGQKAKESDKGIMIRNGKKYINK